MWRLVRLSLFTLVLALMPALAAYAQTGKIAGQVVDASTGESLPGVNVVIDGTTQGAVTDVDGYYTILNVRPGTYDVRASFIGYTPQVKEDVRVNIDLTSEVDFQLQEETVGLDEVVVAAERSVVKRDLSASRVDVSAEQIENLPVTDITKVVGLQAGVQGLSIRGSEANQAAVLLDGLDVGSRRDNMPFTGVSYASVEEIQVQSGGFSAEYGDMRSGVVNIVTKEGGRDRYSADVILNYSPATKKYFGISPSDPNSYWMRPYLDPEVAFVGTEAGWADNEELRQQFRRFDGFNTIAAKTLTDNDPTNDLTPEQAQDLFLFRHRRDLEITEPDFTIDGGFGGPVPLLSDALGNLRFYASYRQEQSQYIIPLTRDGYDERMGRLKLTSDVAPGMKLVVEGMLGRQLGTAEDYPRNGPTRLIKDGDPLYTIGTDGLAEYNRAEDWIFGTGAASIGDVERSMIGAKFTHTLTPASFYEVRLQRSAADYFTRPPRERNVEECVYQVTDVYCVNEAPFGFSFEPHDSNEGMRMGAHWSEFRDTSNVVTYAGRFDFTSQVNRTNMVKAGIELEVSPQDVSYGYWDFLLNPDDFRTSWNQTEIYGAAYLQDKLEFRGMVANVGLRLDYLDPNMDWWVIEDPYTDAFMGKNADEMAEMLEQERVSPQLALSPRLGISFPVTEASKLYFNYGHFLQRPVPEYLYALQRDFIQNRVYQIANPEAPMERTIAYELGYEQSFLEQFLVRVAGYYKDVRDQQREVRFRSLSGLVDYTINVPDNYVDTRGFEISLYKNAGRWIRGFLNYTYMVRSEGNFGYGSFFENRQEQRNYERETDDYYQEKPLPQPFARFNIEFLVPETFGPETGGMHLLGDWRISLLGEWQAGEYFTFTGAQEIEGVRNNMQWKGYRMVDARFSKSFDFGFGSTLFFVDVENLFNLKNFNASSFSSGEDRREYLLSLKLPEEMVEGWEQNYQWKDGDTPIYGDDVPGELDGDYIDAPNLTSFRYLFPRTVSLGLRLSF